MKSFYNSLLIKVLFFILHLSLYLHLLIIRYLMCVLFVLVLYLVLVLRWMRFILWWIFNLFIMVLDMMVLHVLFLLFRMIDEMIFVMARNFFSFIVFREILLLFVRLFVCNALCIVLLVLRVLLFFSLILFFAFLIILVGHNSLFLFNFFHLITYHSIIAALLIVFIAYR